MTTPRFLQIHTLHSYTAALLNRDDTGQAKRLTYGGKTRTRISSQCLKRHWRIAQDDPNALQKLSGFVDSFRSRELVTIKVIEPLREHYPEKVITALDSAFQKLVYGDKADQGKKSRQTLLLGQPELDWLAAQAKEIAASSDEDASNIEDLIKEKCDKKNLQALRDQTCLPGGIVAAMFGRMVTSDTSANIDAPIHVAHSFTVHAAEAEGDYFTAVDDLKKDDDDSGADTIQETEVICGLYYGYVVIDLPELVRNCGDDAKLAGQIVHNLLYLIAEISPGAKRGSTAPYGRAELMLVEGGDRQPRSLASAFRDAVPNDLEKAVEALQQKLKHFDEAYSTGEERQHLCAGGDCSLSESKRVSLKDLAKWADKKTQEARATA